jgi:uncharacterized protein YegP (UPF0339 family)
VQFVIQDSSDGQYYLEVLAGGNNATIAVTETYKRKADARNAADLLQRDGGSATIVDKTQ